MNEGKYYTTLNDAQIHQSGLRKGNTEIWYLKNEAFKDLWNLKAIHKEVPLPKTKEDLQQTHVLLGSIHETNLEMIFDLLQGEIYAPQNESHNLIIQNDIHTSMMVGDIIVNRIFSE